MATAKEVAKASTQGTIPTTIEDRPAYVPETQCGQENVGVEDLTIPRLDVIQSLSPQRKKSDPAYIEGAEEGILFNSVTGELYGTSVLFVPCYFRKEYIVWKSRQEGGGFNGAFATKAEASEEAKRLGPSYEVVDTAQHFGLIIKGDGSLEEVVLSCSRSKLKASRQLNTLAKMTNADAFASVYQIDAIEASSDKGDYYSIRVNRKGWSPEHVYNAGKKLYAAVRSAAVDVNRDYAGENPADAIDGTEEF